MERFAPGFRILAQTVLVLVVLGAVWGSVGCASFEGARLYARGTRALESGDAASAILHLERAAALVPHASEIQNHLGLAYASGGRSQAARAAFQRALDLDCDNRAAAHNLARYEAPQSGGKP